MSKDEARERLTEIDDYTLSALANDKASLENTRGVSREWLELLSLLSLGDITREWNSRRVKTS